jgi:hypothetical protein
LICKLLRAIAGNTDAHRYRYDTTLIGAAETIEAFERATMAPTDLSGWLGSACSGGVFERRTIARKNISLNISQHMNAE